MNQRKEQVARVDAGAPGGREVDVARRLTGDMPCVACRYNLRGLSVLEVCPECGTAVRATVLAVVDPYATVLQPIARPRIVAYGLVLWAVAAFVAALVTWLQRAGDVYASLMGVEIRFTFQPTAGTALIVLSSLGALVLIRPHAKIPAWQILAAVAGVGCSLGAAWVYWRIQGQYDLTHTRPFVESSAGKEPRTLLRLLSGALIAGAIAGLRPAARTLASRSLVLRMGRANRQTMLAMLGALGVAGTGDVLRFVSFHIGEPADSLLNTAGIVLIAVGSMLLTVGILGVAVDCLRIARVVIRPSLSIRDVVEEAGSA